MSTSAPPYEPSPVGGAPTHRSLALPVVLLVSTVYVARHLARGWIPFDDGAMAQAAERVLHGELPHRDFDDVYTGGLALWDALAFRVFGVSLLSLRLALFAVFVLWIPALYYIAVRVATPARAAWVTFLAVVWSLPNYNAAMPSWYNLFLATFAIAALSRHLETRNRRWLVVAGVATGLSILVKVVGLYLVAGVLLYLVFDEQETARGQAAGAPGRRPGRAHSLFVTGALASFVAALGLLVSRHAGAPEYVQFWMPGTLLALLLVRREWAMPAGGGTLRARRLAGTMGPFVGGVALPITLFLVPYVASGAVPALLHGVFVLPARRFDVAMLRLPPLYTLLAVLPLALLAWCASRMRRGARWYEGAALVAAVVVLVSATRGNEPLYRAVFYAVRALLPCLVVAGAWALSRPREADDQDPTLARRTFLILACAAMCSLVQFPYAAPNYLVYVAPLVILAALTLLRRLGPVSPAIPRAVLAAFMLFAMLRMNIAHVAMMGVAFRPSRSEPLAMPRSGIRVGRSHAQLYPPLVSAIREHARGEYIWAGPELPEVYFLSGKRNPTRALFDVLSEAQSQEATLQLLDRHGITAIVLNNYPYFSPPPTAAFQRAVASRFPHARTFGTFELRWRN